MCDNYGVTYTNECEFQNEDCRVRSDPRRAYNLRRVPCISGGRIDYTANNLLSNLILPGDSPIFPELPLFPEDPILPSAPLISSGEPLPALSVPLLDEGSVGRIAGPDINLYDIETDPYDHPFKNGSIKTASGGLYSMRLSQIFLSGTVSNSSAKCLINLHHYFYSASMVA